MRLFFKPLILALLMAFPALGQISPPQINLTGNIGCQGFPCVNNGILQFTSDANHTMTATETSAFYMKVTSTVTLTATRNLVAPSGRFPFTIENATTGGQSIQIIGASGTGVTIANGSTVSAWNDGTNYVLIGSPTSSGISGGVSGQVALFGSVSTITAAIPIAGSGAALVSGPATSGNGNVVIYAGTTGATSDSGVALSTLAPKSSPALTGVPTAPTAAVATNTTQIATTAFVLANSGSGGVSGQAAGVVGLGGSATTIASQSHINENTPGTTAVTQNLTAPTMAAGSYTTNGTYTGNSQWGSGTGSIPALASNSAGFAGPASSGTPYLIKLPATITAGLMTTATPGTAEGVNESVMSITSLSAFCMPGSFAAQTDGATVTWAIGSAICANASLLFTVHSGSRTLNLTGLVNGGSYVLTIKQDGTGGEGLTLGTGCTWKVGGGGGGAITPSTGANAIDVLAFTYDGTNCYANFRTNFS